MSIVLPSEREPRSPPRQFHATSGAVRLLARNRFQILGALLIAVLVPALLRPEFGFDSVAYWLRRTDNTTLGTALAVVVGALLLKRITIYPGARAPGYVFPVFAAAYGIVIVGFFFSRFDYSRAQFLISFILSVIWFLFVFRLERRHNHPRYVLLPFGGTDRLASLHGAEWRYAASPHDIPADISALVADLRAPMSPEWERTLADATLRGIPVYHTKQLSEAMTGRVEIEHLSENTFGSLLPSSLYLRFQRVGDVLLALITAPIILPVLGLAMLGVLLCCGRPVFFTQDRVGYRGRTFKIWKLRTMRPDAASGEAFTVDRDPRITRIGHVLRRTRIDELPQIWNIFKGDMSWIGPRPEALLLSRWYESKIPFYRYRHIVRPGITGWAAVNQGNVAQVEAATYKLHYDFYYIKYFSFWLDLLIVAKTVRTLLTGFGSK